MASNAYADADYRQPNIPPATPPAIDGGASAHEAASLVDDDGDSDAPGSRPAGFDRSREDERLFDGNRGNGGDRDYPGEQPDEVAPEPGDNDVPGQTPDEVAPDQGDFDRPDSSPIESPPLPGTGPDTGPMETPPPPD